MGSIEMISISPVPRNVTFPSVPNVSSVMLPSSSRQNVSTLRMPDKNISMPLAASKTGVSSIVTPIPVITTPAPLKATPIHKPLRIEIHLIP